MAPPRFDSKALYEKLDKQRLAQGLSSQDVARATGVSAATLRAALPGGLERLGDAEVEEPAVLSPRVVETHVHRVTTPQIADFGSDLSQAAEMAGGSPHSDAFSMSYLPIPGSMPGSLRLFALYANIAYMKQRRATRSRPTGSGSTLPGANAGQLK